MLEALMAFVYVSNDCHRHCEDCYWNNPTPRMTEEMALKSSRWIAETCREQEVKKLRILFLGGEPLNNEKIIFQFIDDLENHLPKFTESHQDGKYILFTNGDLLTEDILSNLKSRKVFICVNPTYDSLEEVEKKILRVKRACGGCSLAISLNTLNMQRLPELTELAVRHNCKLRVNRLYHGGNIPGYIDEYTKQMSKMFEILLVAPTPVYPNWIMESTYPTWEGPKNCYSCGKWLAIIDTDGGIRSCNPDPTTVIGHIGTHRWNDLVFLQRWTSKNLPECQGCEWVVWCQGGCPYTRKLTWGTYEKASPFCSAFKELFPRLTKLKERWEN